MESEERTSMVPLIIGLAVIAVGVFIGSAIILWFWPGFRPLSPSGLTQVIGSGKLVTKDMEFRDFTVVDVGYAFEVEITRSSFYSVTITMDDNLFDYLEASKTGERLEIRLKPGYSYRSVTKRAKITMRDLHELELSGATHCFVKGFSSSHRFVGRLSAASSLEMVDVSAGDTGIELSGASLVTGGITVNGDVRLSVSGASSASSAELEGRADDMVVDASGASSLELSGFPVHNADVELSGASRATVNLHGRLDADLSGASHLLYIGQPTIGEIQTSSGSTIGEK